MGLLLKSVTEDNPYNGGDLLVKIETRITDSVSYAILPIDL